MVFKASINGPNRRLNRVGNRAAVSIFTETDDKAQIHSSREREAQGELTFSFRVRTIESFLNTERNKKSSSHAFGDACLFTVGRSGMGQTLLEKHFRMIGSPDSTSPNSDDPVLIHFHDIPVFISRAIPVPINVDNNSSADEIEDTEDIIYLSQVHCHNHKICGKHVLRILF